MNEFKGVSHFLLQRPSGWKTNRTSAHTKIAVGVSGEKNKIRLQRSPTSTPVITSDAELRPNHQLSALCRLEVPLRERS